MWFLEVKMKLKLFLAANAAILAFVTVASADGYTAPQPTPEPVVVETQADHDWSGAYVGGTLSYFSGSTAFCDNSFLGTECNNLQVDTPEPEAEGGMIGVTAGYDWQSGSLVYGVVGDLMFGDLSGMAPSNINYGCGAGCEYDVQSVAMLRGRLGYAMNDFLVYGSAGVAISRVSIGETGVSSSDDTVTNFVVGLGGEYMLSDNLSAGLEVLHFIESDDSVIDDAFCGVGNCGGTDFSATAVRAALVYRF
ncbi:outer membrane protein [Alterinioella nitratireducens]|uniref:outer membrane protein n=1 Tax=Alterinioella nitratireducens TaxID=2735915 RepID=UPI00155661CA|nr:outer membrane beta-barrel protein [Alterinioella nitratireducens]NPD21064.1 porin family protein [Alterinioella nitratireducens]